MIFPLLRFTYINTFYSLIHILQDVNIEVFAGEIVYLLGQRRRQDHDLRDSAGAGEAHQRRG